MGHHFICYSEPYRGLEFAIELTDALASGPPAIGVWIDKRKLSSYIGDWDAAIDEAIRTCDSLIFIMTPDSVEDQSVCKNEWTWALKYKKPIVPLKWHRDAAAPFRLSSRQLVDFTGPFDPALAGLRQRLQWLGSPAGHLHALKDRLADAKRDLRRAVPDQESRIRKDIEELEAEIAERQKVVDNPQAAIEKTQKSIETRIETERQPERPVGGATRTKFINPPPAAAPAYFQDRFIETKLVADFLEDGARRLMIVVGRAGIGKSAMVCRLLKSLEMGRLPDDGRELTVDGIVYLSAKGSRKLTVPTLFADLCTLLPDDTAARLDALYRDPHPSIATKVEALLAAFPRGRTVLLLDNFEDVIEPATQQIVDAALDEALRTFLTGPQHGVKAILTTRLAPRELNLLEPGRQGRVELDSLGREDAITVLRQLDGDGTVRLQRASDALLTTAWERTRGYPRALEALYAILAVDRDTTLDDILTDASRLLPDNVVQVLVGDAFSRLDSIAQQVMEALALYERPVSATAIDHLLAPFIPAVNSAPVLSRLVTQHFARREGGRLYYLHPVDRAYALSRVPEGMATDRDADEPAPFTRHALWHRAADYYAQVRRPRAEWRRLDDLAPQLAEFDLRCAGVDFDTAAQVLLEVDFNYLLTWGHYALMVAMHERLRGRIEDADLQVQSVGNLGTAYQELGRVEAGIRCYEEALAGARATDDRRSEGVWVGNLGLCYAALGQTARAIEYHEQALAIAREIGYRQGEAIHLGNLGNRYAGLGQTARAIEYHEQALTIDREIGYRQGEADDLGNLGHCYADLDQTARAIEYHEQALAIAREIGSRYVESCVLTYLAEAAVHLNDLTRARREAAEATRIGDETGNAQNRSDARRTLALAHLRSGDVNQASAVAREARHIDYPPSNHAVAVLAGIIAVVAGDLRESQGAFKLALALVADRLAKNNRDYQSLETQGLALTGMALVGEAERVPAAIAAFRAARAITRDPGIVTRTLRLLDLLVERDRSNMLTAVRRAAAGTDA